MAGEEHEHAAVGGIGQVADHLDHRRGVGVLVLARLGHVVGNSEDALGRDSRKATAGSPCTVTGESGPARPTRDLEEIELAAGRQRRAGEHDRLEPIEEQRRGGSAPGRAARRAGATCWPRERPLHPPHRRRPPLRRAERPVEPVRQPFESPEHRPELLQDRGRWRSVSSDSASRSAMVSTGPGQRAERAQRWRRARTPAPASQTRSPANSSSSRSWPAVNVVESRQEPVEASPRSRGGRRRARAAAAAAAGRGWRGSAGRPVLTARAASVGASPRPFRSKRESSRRTPRLVTWMPRCAAATSSR